MAAAVLKGAAVKKHERLLLLPLPQRHLLLPGLLQLPAERARYKLDLLAL
jgi:hypothetical protein